MKPTYEEQKQFNLAIIREGLGAIAASNEEQIKLNEQGLIHLDHIFDPMPIDYIPWLIKNQIIESSLSNQLLNLYQEIGEEIDKIDYIEQNKFITNNSSKLVEWRRTAVELVIKFQKI